MGKVAAEMADQVIVTSDNPRGENPTDIIDQILAGIPDRRNCHVEIDRRDALKMAIGWAQKNDVVLIAGKGHETYQILKDKTVSFDDRQVAREILADVVRSK
jgi:UDP-N-acetylmuramoyl-L-alanyl-D-glutamate--2,6-diaminopimelate ligase